MSFFLEQLQAAAAAEPAKREQRQRYNPNPPGQPKPGSATEAVLAELRRTGAAMSEAQLRWVTKGTHSAVSWAVLRLCDWGLIVKIADASRHARYCRYRAVKVEGNDER